MKVLKPGRQQKGWSTEARCTGKGNGDGGCGALLLVEQADAYETTRSHYDGEVEHFATFRCGACGVETDLARPPPFKLPPRPKAAAAVGDT